MGKMISGAGTDDNPALRTFSVDADNGDEAGGRQEGRPEPALNRGVSRPERPGRNSIDERHARGAQVIGHGQVAAVDQGDPEGAQHTRR